MAEIIMRYYGNGEDFHNLERIGRLVRCGNCIYFETGKSWSAYCSHPDGLDDAKETDFCSRGEARCSDS